MYQITNRVLNFALTYKIAAGGYVSQRNVCCTDIMTKLSQQLVSIVQHAYVNLVEL